MTSIGRDGASDAVSFIRVGTPAVEFGPVGGGHHGPEEWVSISSLAAYRRTLCDFARSLPAAIEPEAATHERRATTRRRARGRGARLRDRRAAEDERAASG